MADSSRVARLRLAAQRLAGQPSADPVAAAEHLLALQGQDLPSAALALALRTRVRSVDAVREALDAGALVRTWTMRGTLHLLTAEDAAWLVPLLAPRQATTLRRRQAELGLGAEHLERAAALADELLADGGRTRGELTAAWGASGIPVAGQCAYHLLVALGHDGRVVLGPTRHGEQLVVLARDVLPQPSTHDRAEALAELAYRYVRGHGPASAEDLARWAGLPLGEARTALAAAGDRVEVLQADERELLLHPETAQRMAASDTTELLLVPAFDELILGYADRTATLDRADEALVVPGGNGIFRPIVVQDARAVGTWSRDRGGWVVVRAFDDAASPSLQERVDQMAGSLPHPGDPRLRR